MDVKKQGRKRIKSKKKKKNNLAYIKESLTRLT